MHPICKGFQTLNPAIQTWVASLPIYHSLFPLKLPPHDEQSPPLATFPGRYPAGAYELLSFCFLTLDLQAPLRVLLLLHQVVLSSFPVLSNHGSTHPGTHQGASGHLVWDRYCAPSRNRSQSVLHVDCSIRKVGSPQHKTGRREHVLEPVNVYGR